MIRVREITGKIILITGISGQDGSYLAEFLLSKNYEVHGLIRRSATDNLKNIAGIKDKVYLHYGDLENEHHLCSLVYKLQPAEIYNLASQSDVRVSFDTPEYTGNITGLGVTRILEAVRNFSPKSKVFQASTSEMFGNATPPQSENTPMVPRSPYGAAKLYGYNMCRIYREAYGLFICNGIGFNHESPRRGENFVTKKIVKGLLDAKRGKIKKLHLGNLEAKRDWGFAGDYVRAMYLMLQQDKPDDYVIGTGEAHSVKDLLQIASKYIEISWKDYVEIDRSLFRPTEVNSLLADSRKARERLGWKPEVSFKDLVKMMVDYELNEK
jgi:GDPmannose 4,6-dehydratase